MRAGRRRPPEAVVAVDHGGKVCRRAGGGAKSPVLVVGGLLAKTKKEPRMNQKNPQKDRSSHRRGKEGVRLLGTGGKTRKLYKEIERENVEKI